MAKKISQLSLTTSLTGSEIVPILQGGTNKRTTLSAIRDYLNGAVALNVPTSFSHGTPTSSDCALSWNDSNVLPNESSLQIQISTDIGFASIVQTLNPSANATSATVSGLNPTTNYYARIKAVGNGTTVADSDWSPATSFTTAASGAAMNAPGSFTPTVVSDSQINLAWTDTNASPNETGIEVQRGYASDYSDAVTVNTTAANATSYNNTGLIPKTHYYFRVRAKGNGTTTTDSSWVNANAITNDAVALSNTVEAGGYITPAAGTSLYVAASEFHVLNYAQKERIRQNGTITQIKGYFDFTLGGGTVVYFDVWRLISTNNYQRIAHVDITSHIVGASTVTITGLSVAVQEGDFTGVSWIGDPGGTFLSVLSYASTGLYYKAASVTSGGEAWESRSALNFTYPWKIFMQAPVAVMIGDSIMAGFPGNASFIEAAHSNGWTTAIPYKVANALGWTYQNMAIGGQITLDIATRITADVVNLKPRIAFIEGGVNDANTGYTLSQIQTNYTNILTAMQSNNIIPIVILVLPWANGTNSQNQLLDQVNAWLITNVPTYGGRVVDARATVGQFRTGGDAGNLWDIQAAYNSDGVHYNASGYTAIAGVASGIFG